jgi:hypothetical protein
MKGGEEELYHHGTKNGTTMRMCYTRAVATHVYDTPTKLAKRVK